jgi:hypothetical protein
VKRILESTLLFAAMGSAMSVAALPACAQQVLSSVRGSTSGLSLDHVPVAVHDLAGAVQRWQELLGFSIKPGRVHPNSLRNAHVKFPDGTEIELITASRGADALAARYRQLIERGDGPAFLALRPDTLNRIARRLREAERRFVRSATAYSESIAFDAESPFRYLFFIVLTAPPVDLAEHLTHTNTGSSLYAVWLRKRDYRFDEQLLAHLGVPIRRGAVMLAGGELADDVALDNGHLYLIHASNADDDRPVIGLTVVVTSVDKAQAWLRDHGVPVSAGSDARGRHVRVEPGNANGVWLEFLQPGGR